jgi:cell division protein FtsI (penicillin-binding protein 3)
VRERTPLRVRRQMALLGLTAAALAVCAGKLVYVQALAGPELAATALAWRTVTEEIPAERGEILDRNGVVMATSVERWNIAVDQRQLARWKKDGDSVADAAELLGPILGVPPAELGPQLIGDAAFRYIAKGVAPEVYEQVMDLRILGVFGERVSQRLYPNGTTAGNVLGFVGTDGYGLAGLEQVWEDTLAGTPGSDTYERGEDGQRIPTGREEYVPAVPGRDVQLTIDRDYQYTVQQMLDAQVRATGAAWGAVEVVDVRTGEVLVLADSGAIDPNDPAHAEPSRAVSYTYEPGSTAKAITMAAILETGIATPTSPFTVPYQYTTPNGQTFKDSHEHPTLPLTLTGILAESSNTGTVMVGQQLPRQVRHDYLAKFGFGSRTGIGLPGETGGLLHDAEDWDGRSEFAVLFGQAVGATTVQNTQVFATLANHGVRVQPHVVAAVEDENGVMQPVELEEPRQVVSAETADTVLRMLESAVLDGTGGKAAVPGYRIAGKTGTAQAFEPGGVIKVVASFIGVAPADDPRLAVNVVLYDPKSSVYGGSVAAPLFRDVTAFGLQHLGIPPSGTTPELFPTTHS